MKDFTLLISKLDSTSSTSYKIRVLSEYFRKVSDKDGIWTLALFTQQRPKRIVSTKLLREWGIETSGFSVWLFEESLKMVGDIAETVALVLPENQDNLDWSLSKFFIEMQQIRNADDSEKKEWVIRIWRGLSKDERYFFNKIITGGINLSLEQHILIKTLSRVYQIDESEMAYQLIGDWNPTEHTIVDLINRKSEGTPSKPYPFNSGHPLNQELDLLGEPSSWLAEKTWEGILVQLIIRDDKWYLWSSNGELLNRAFPEFADVTNLDNGVVIIGELVIYRDSSPANPSELKKRLGRQKPSKKLMEEFPAKIMAQDLLEWKGRDLRKETFAWRKERLSYILTEAKLERLIFVEAVGFPSWQKLEADRIGIRGSGSEGIMLKLKDSTYLDASEQGSWYILKADPFKIDAILTYAQTGTSSRNAGFTDYTFGLWDEHGQLVTFAKTYAGLNDEEHMELAGFIRANTIEKFGPVRRVKEKHVFELAFDGISHSSRHKSGVVLRSPRIVKWKREKKLEEGGSLENLKKLIK